MVRGRAPLPRAKGRAVKARGSVILFHATTRGLAYSIGKSGLLTRKSLGRLAAVWLHCASKRAWAAIHVAQRHNRPIDRVIVYRVRVPRAWLRRHSAGLWACMRDIPPARILGSQDVARLAASPVQ